MFTITTQPSSPSPAAVSVGDEPSDDDLSIEQLRAALLVQREQTENLRVALASNRTIGTAVGLIMSEYRLSIDSAFGVLVRLSQNENRKVNALAGDLIDRHCAEVLAASVARDARPAAGLIAKRETPVSPHDVRPCTAAGPVPPAATMSGASAI